MTPESWYRETIGKRIDTDNYPRSNPYQCWDYFDLFCRTIGFYGSRYCSLTGYVGDLWKLRYKYGFATKFYFVSPNEIKEGDWVFWDRHVAFYFAGMEVGQNQNGRNYVTSMPMNWNGVLGAMRYKGWEKPKSGVAELFSSVIAGRYKTTTAVNFRTGGSIDFTIIECLPKGTVVDCYGYYHMNQNTPWLYVTAPTKDGNCNGFVCSDYLTKL